MLADTATDTAEAIDVEERMAAEHGYRLAKEIARLPEQEKIAVTLINYEGLTPGEIAVRMNRSENAIHALQHRGRRRLQAELEQLGVTPVAMAA